VFFGDGQVKGSLLFLKKKKQKDFTHFAAKLPETLNQTGESFFGSFL